MLTLLALPVSLSLSLPVPLFPPLLSLLHSAHLLSSFSTSHHLPPFLISSLILAILGWRTHSTFPFHPSLNGHVPQQGHCTTAGQLDQQTGPQTSHNYSTKLGQKQVTITATCPATNRSQLHPCNNVTNPLTTLSKNNVRYLN